MCIRDRYTTMRAWRHDYHNHLQNLKAKLRKAELEESLSYLNELEQELDDIRQLVETEMCIRDRSCIVSKKISWMKSNNI